MPHKAICSHKMTVANKTNKAHDRLVEQPGPNLSNTRALLDLTNIYVVNGCLNEGVHVVEHVVVHGSKYKVCLKEFIKSSQRTSHFAWFDLLVQNNEELMDGTPLHPNSNKIPLSGALDCINMVLNTCSILRTKSQN